MSECLNRSCDTAAYLGLRFPSGRNMIPEGHSRVRPGELPETLVIWKLQKTSARSERHRVVILRSKGGCNASSRNGGQPPPPVGTGGRGAFPRACGFLYHKTGLCGATTVGPGMAQRREALKIQLFTTGSLARRRYHMSTLYRHVTAPFPTTHPDTPGHCVWQGTCVPPINVAAKRQ